MDEKQFLGSCKVKAPDELKPYIPRAIESAESCFGIYTKTSSGKIYSRADIPKVVQLAGMFHRLAEQNKEEYTSEPDIFLNINPETVITAEELIKDIIPTIVELRTAIFNTEDPPFPDDIQKAMDWLEMQVQKERRVLADEMRNKNVPMPKMINQLINHAQKIAKEIPDGEVTVTVKKLTIPVQSEDGKIKKLPVYKGHISESVSKITKRLSEITNFSQVDLLSFFLTGIKPVLPAMRARQGLSNYPYVQVDFFRGLKNSEMASLIRYVNRKLKPTKKELNSTHLELYQFVTLHGGEPATGKMEFWERLLHIWNRRNPNRQYKSNKCIQIAYKRILQSLRIKR